MELNHRIRPLGLLSSIAIYLPAACLLYGMTHYMIPFLERITGWEKIILWFIVGGLGVFLPLILMGIIMLGIEGNGLRERTFHYRLRFRRLSSEDLKWTIFGLLVIGLLTGLLMTILQWLPGGLELVPPFMTVEPLTPDRYWILAAWFPYWLLNIIGEEFFWRGVLLPRQELSFGENGWVIHGIGWTIFHIAFGWQLLVLMLPLLFIQSYVVQHTRNSWVGVIMHGLINGPSFLAISLGLI